jgi:hypothetical protein
MLRLLILVANLTHPVIVICLRHLFKVDMCVCVCVFEYQLNFSITLQGLKR